MFGKESVSKFTFMDKKANSPQLPCFIYKNLNEQNLGIDRKCYHFTTVKMQNYISSYLLLEKILMVEPNAWLKNETNHYI